MIVNGNSNTDIRDWQEVRVLGFKVEISTKKMEKILESIKSFLGSVSTNSQVKTSW